MAKKPAPTFEVRFVAPGILPEKVPLHAVSEALAALQDLASGRDPLEGRRVPLGKQIGLLQVLRGSAVYSCVSRAPEEAQHNLRLVGTMLRDLDKPDSEGDLMVTAFRPIEALSVVARTMGCRLEVYSASTRTDPIFTIEGGDFDRLSSKLLLKGDTTVIGKVIKVGGAKEMKCLMRVPGRTKMLYCDVDNATLVRQLGQHLYEDIAAIGTAIWIHRSWYIYKFTVRSFTQPKLGDPSKAIKKLRNAGLKAWDTIQNPEAYLRESTS